jgi:beta-glucosidase
MRRFPEGFLLGCATSSHQVEGGNTNNDWWDWESRPRRIADGSRSGDACGWWSGRAEDDLSLAAELGQNAHRLGLEWSRLEPEPGCFDAAAFDRYAHLLAHLRSLGMRSMVTLHHFTLPRWVGPAGWTDRSLIDRFAQLAADCARRLGSLVDLWATINEPMVLAFMAYLGRAWPPGHGSIPSLWRAARNLSAAHVAAWQAVHRELADAQVGIVLNQPAFDPSRPRDPRDRAITWLQDQAFNQRFLDALDGRYDFLGLNYYGRYLVRFDLGAPAFLFGRHVQSPSVKTDTNDWGQIHPAGLTARLTSLARSRVPLYVTESGIYDNDDRLRPSYLRDHLAATLDAIDRGADVRGYFHWSLIDNFEWAEGWRTHFGLIAVDPRTQSRRPKASAEAYAAICRARGL